MSDDAPQPAGGNHDGIKPRSPNSTDERPKRPHPGHADVERWDASVGLPGDGFFQGVPEGSPPIEIASFSTRRVPEGVIVQPSAP